MLGRSPCSWWSWFRRFFSSCECSQGASTEYWTILQSASMPACLLPGTLGMHGVESSTDWRNQLQAVSLCPEVFPGRSWGCCRIWLTTQKSQWSSLERVRIGHQCPRFTASEHTRNRTNLNCQTWRDVTWLRIAITRETNGIWAESSCDQLQIVQHELAMIWYFRWFDLNTIRMDYYQSDKKDAFILIRSSLPSHLFLPTKYQKPLTISD